MLMVQLENVAQLGNFPITTTELNEDDYQQALAESPLVHATTKEECRDVVQMIHHVASIARMNELPQVHTQLRIVSLVYRPSTQRFALFAVYPYGMMVVDLMQSGTLATKRRDMHGRASEEPDVPAWYEADDVYVLSKLLKTARDIYVTVVQGALTVVGTLKTGQRYVIAIPQADQVFGFLPMSLLDRIDETAQASLVAMRVEELEAIKKRGRDVVKLLRDKDKKRHPIAELHIFTKDDEPGAVFYQFPQVSDASFVIPDTIARNPFDRVALNPELLMLPDRGSVSMYIPPAEPASRESEGSIKTYVRKPIQLSWSRGSMVTWELLMPVVPHYFRYVKRKEYRHAV
jgi:hypothetical protein